MKLIPYTYWINENFNKDIIVLLPGSYKPMHAAHVNLINRYANQPDVKEVKVLIGPGVRNGVTQKEAIEVAKLLLHKLHNVSIEATIYPSPILTAYKYMETAKPGIYAMGGVKKGKDYDRVEKFVRDFSPNGRYVNTKLKNAEVVELLVDTKPLLYKDRTDEYDGMPISASILRQDILNDDYNNFRTNYPGYAENIIKKIWDTTQIVISESINEKFSDESDPVQDMGIGIIEFWKKERQILGHNTSVQNSIRYFYDPAFYNEAHLIYVFFKELVDYDQNFSQAGIQKTYNKILKKLFTKVDIYKVVEILHDLHIDIKHPNNFLALDESITSQTNIHMTHAEDLVFKGKEAIDWVIYTFENLYKQLKGETNKDNIKLSIKFDGAPSVFVWSKFSELKKPGLAIKALFAKNRKIMFSDNDIEKFYGDRKDLTYKLKLMLKYITSLKIPENEIWQGDFLFDSDTLIEDEKTYSFHPNTIIYKINKDSNIGKEISKADIGVVWHTKYTGTSLTNVSASYNVNIDELQKNPKVFMTDPYIKSLAGIITLTKEESDSIKSQLDAVKNLVKHSLISSENYNKLINDKEIISLFMIFQNLLIRNSQTIIDTQDYVYKFINFVSNRFKKESEKKKSIKGKKDLIIKSKDIVQKIKELSDILEKVIEVIIMITDIKQVFIKKLNNIGKFETYLKTITGEFKSTSQEGFAVSDIHGNVVKLVDRNEFSYANFSPNIIKGWSKK